MDEEKDEFEEAVPPKDLKKAGHDDLLDDGDLIDDPLVPADLTEPDEVSLEDEADKEEEEAAVEDSFDDVDLY